MLDVGTGFKEVAWIRSELDSLRQYLTDVKNVYFKEKFETCRDKCQSAFKKLREEKQEHAQQINQLKQQITELERNKKEQEPRFSEDPGNFVYNVFIMHILLPLLTVCVYIIIDKSPPAKKQKIYG